jgi:hypothetical protein
METLEKYLNLSKESCPLNNLISPSIHDDLISTTDSNNNPSSTINLDQSSSITEPNSISTPVINKKLSRTSFNSFSKIIRRTFIEPFSSVKRSSLKHQQKQNFHPHTPDTSIINENEHIRRVSSPLLNRRTNLLTIILTNFQPKRPKTCDNMIKNYIDACMNEYRLEKSPKQIADTLINENENNDLVYHRYQSSNRYQNEPSGRKLPSIPANKHIQKTSDIDDNDDLLPMENGPFSSNINYVQRKSIQLTQVKFLLRFQLKLNFEILE